MPYRWFCVCHDHIEPMSSKPRAIDLVELLVSLPLFRVQHERVQTRLCPQKDRRNIDYRSSQRFLIANQQQRCKSWIRAWLSIYRSTDNLLSYLRIKGSDPVAASTLWFSLITTASTKGGPSINEADSVERRKSRTEGQGTNVTRINSRVSNGSEEVRRGRYTGRWA